MNPNNIDIIPVVNLTAEGIVFLNTLRKSINIIKDIYITKKEKLIMFPGSKSESKKKTFITA